MEKFIHVDRCDSTQDLLKEQLKLTANSELTVSCEFQAHGHGRGKTIWEDTPGTVCFSMTITPHGRASFTALELSLLICRFFESKGHPLKLKWPNDLLNKENKKCGGVLVQGANGLFIAGIGLNLYYLGTSYGGVYDNSFEMDKKRWVKDISLFIRANRYFETKQLAQDWLQRCNHLNQKVTVFEGGKSVEGIFVGLGENGEALVQTEQNLAALYNGTLRVV